MAQTTKNVSNKGFEASSGENAVEVAHAARSAATPVPATIETTASRTVENLVPAPELPIGTRSRLGPAGGSDRDEA
jgi:hypothetical protein